MRAAGLDYADLISPITAAELGILGGVGITRTSA